MSTWHEWKNLGGQLSSGPAASSWGTDRIDCFARDPDNRLVHNYWNGATWRGWHKDEEVTLTFQDAPSAVSRAQNTLDILVRGANDHMYYVSYDNGWRPAVDLGGVLTAGPAISSWGKDRLDTVHRGRSGGQVWHKGWNGSQWGGFTHINAETIKGALCAVSRKPNYIDVFARGWEDQVLHMVWDGSKWSSWKHLGGQYIASDLAVASWGPERLDIFALSHENTLVHRRWDGAWHSWEHLRDEAGVTLASTPAAVSRGEGLIDVFVRGDDNAMWHKAWY